MIIILLMISNRIANKFNNQSKNKIKGIKKELKLNLKFMTCLGLSVNFRLLMIFIILLSCLKKQKNKEKLKLLL